MANMDEKMVLTEPDLELCCHHIQSCGQFGFDTEFVGEDTYHPSLCLIQVATPETLYLVDPFAFETLDRFWQTILDPQLLMVVHAGREEIRLCQRESGRPPEYVFDLQIAAGLVGFPYPLGHGPLVNQVVGVQLAKAETLTEWRERPLTQSQIRYAYDDVRYLLAAWNELNSRLAALGRERWAVEEFAKLKEAAVREVVEPSGAEKWRKLRGVGGLDRRRLAVLRELYQWRTSMAAETNRPARMIVRDDLLVAIARRNPSRERDLRAIRGVARKHLPDIMDAVERARALPLSDCPAVRDVEQDPPQVGLISNILGVVLSDYCARHELAANLVAAGRDLKLLARAAVKGDGELPTDCGLVHGWRAEFVLPELMAVLEGRRGLNIKDPAAENPFGYFDVDSKPTDC